MNTTYSMVTNKEIREMTLYFITDSRQKKLLIESDYAVDIYDVIISFFEEHKRFPHILYTEKNGKIAVVRFESTSEMFLVEDINDEEYSILNEMVRKY